jgi:hypothetical protein
MITSIVKTLLFRLFWSALWGMGWGMLLDGGMPDIAHMSIGWGVALFLFLLVFACLLADLPAVLAQRQHMPKEHAEKTTHAAGARARTPFFILQKGTARRGCNTQFLRAILQEVTARFTAFCEEWVATHSETQEKNHAGA